MSDNDAGSVGAPDSRRCTAATGKIALLSEMPMGTFDAEGNYIPRTVTEDDLTGASLDDAIASTIVEFDDGDIVEGDGREDRQRRSPA